MIGDERMSAMINPLNYDSLEFYHHLAREALTKYSLSKDASVKLLNYSENITYLVEDHSALTVLRLNRPGYHLKKELEAEILWLESLLESSEIVVPEPIPGINGRYVQEIKTENLTNPFHCIMISYLAGQAPDEDNEQELIPKFEKLGEVTALLHNHSQEWDGSRSINRPVWDYETTLGSNPKWGRWQDGIAITPERKMLFEQVSKTIEKRLKSFGKSSDYFGLIHADLRLANLLVENDTIKVIDFDDCGFSWYLYDLATALSFIEHKEYVPDLTEAWLSGYKKLRSISIKEEEEIPTFIMLRRLLLVAWIGSHDNDTAKSLGADFTELTVELAEKYLYQFG